MSCLAAWRADGGGSPGSIGGGLDCGFGTLHITPLLRRSGLGYDSLKAEGVERPAQISYVYATTAEVGHLVRARDMVRVRARATR